MKEVLTVPVHLTDCARLNAQVRSSHGLGDWEVTRIGNAYLTASSVDGLLVKHLVGKLQLGLLITLGVAWNLLLDRVRVGALENVLLRLGNSSEDLRMHAEVLSKDRLGRAPHPVREQEGRVLGEVAIVKDEEELSAIGAETLQRVGVARWEVPQVALLEIVDEAATLGVEGGDADLAFENISPFGFLVPMELADDPFIESHVHTGQFFAGAELADGRLTCPATLLDADVGVGKGPAHVGDSTMIRAGRANKIRVLPFSRSVPRA
jgi:hypothetical protein